MASQINFSIESNFEEESDTELEDVNLSQLEENILEVNNYNPQLI